ncbi:hypothetical protein PspTeo4_10192 [Pseudomonas sp. Teo4]|nr:hypothetical protein [Pseudomonas sp. Teo4]
MSFEQLLGLVLNPELLERYGPRFVDGLLVTAKLVAISFSLGAVFGLLLALARMSRSLLLQRMPLAISTFSVARRCWRSCSCFTTAWVRSKASGRTSGCGGSSARRGSAPCWPSP